MVARIHIRPFSIYDFYDALAPELHDRGLLLAPDSREPWFVCDTHDVKCLGQSLDKFSTVIDITIKKCR
jgi:glutamate-1-semialdehyde 2,1-aminomutase